MTNATLVPPSDKNIATAWRPLTAEAQALVWLRSGPVSISTACAQGTLLLNTLARLSKRRICRFEAGAYHLNSRVPS